MDFFNNSGGCFFRESNGCFLLEIRACSLCKNSDHYRYLCWFDKYQLRRNKVIPEKYVYKARSAGANLLPIMGYGQLEKDLRCYSRVYVNFFYVI